MLFENIRVSIALIWCAAATYFDLFNNRNVPNLLTYSMVGLGGLFALLSLVLDMGGVDMTSLLFSLGPAILIFAFGYYFYVNGQIGGADVLVFVAIALLLPQQPASLLGDGSKPLMQIPYVISIFAISGVLFSAYMFFSMLPRVLGALLQKRVKLELQKTLLAVFVVVLYGVFLWNMYSMSMIPPAYLGLTAVVILSATFVYLFKDFILDEYVIKTVPLSEIDEEDVLAIDKMDPEVVKEHGLKKLLTAGELERMKKLPIKKFPVYKNMPCFMPYILVALLLTLVVGDIFSLLLKLR